MTIKRRLFLEKAANLMLKLNCKLESDGIIINVDKMFAFNNEGWEMTKLPKYYPDCFIMPFPLLQLISKMHGDDVTIQRFEKFMHIQTDNENYVIGFDRESKDMNALIEEFTRHEA